MCVTGKGKSLKIACNKFASSKAGHNSRRGRDCDFRDINLLRMRKIMVSLTACALAVVQRAISMDPAPYVYDLPPPAIAHQHFDSLFLEKFDEILLIGDVHGCYDELKILLETNKAEKEKTLKICVGDLVNKGPKSQEVLNLFRNSNSMFSVRGNHDEVVLREYLNSRDPNYRLKENNTWIKNLSLEDIEYIKQLPFTISLPSLNAIIVHAGLVPGQPLEKNKPYDMIHMRNLVDVDYFWEGGLLPTENTTEGKPWASLWHGPQHVYFGHDAKRMLQKYSYATGLDTGCVYGNWLTGLFISGPREGNFVQVKALKVYSQPKSKN
ncbi:Bis(5'-nucleosyl)-tetraphosphatase, symmetrical, partial [Stegodyphus mimosarum]